MPGSNEAQQHPRTHAHVRKEFFERPSTSARSPLESLMSRFDASGGGGAGGYLRIALLLSILWIHAAEPYDSKRVAPYWARLLGLQDPTGNGARAIRDTLGELDRRAFIKIEAVDSTKNRILLLNERGEGKKYAPPIPPTELYVRVPKALWSEGWITEMSGRALSMYLAVLSYAGWRDEPFWISAREFHARYGMSESTRKKGLADLVALGVLEVIATSTSDREGERTYRRNVYTLIPQLQSGRAAEFVPGTPASVTNESAAIIPPPEGEA